MLWNRKIQKLLMYNKMMNFILYDFLLIELTSIFGNLLNFNEI